MSQQQTDTYHQTASQHCERCRHHKLCQPGDGAEPLFGRRVRVARHATLYQAGELGSNSIYAIRSGSFKLLREGPDQEAGVVGFAMAPEFIGLNEIGQRQQTCTVVALEDSEVCKLAWQPLLRRERREPDLPDGLHALLSDQIRREQAITLMLRNTHADQRLAAFLLSLSERHVANGYAACEFRLQMARGEIASFLGVTAECLSRLLIQMKDQDILSIVQREVSILDLPALRELAAGPLPEAYLPELEAC
ncbi:MAG: helix-turn-helix domain-containing protein [Sphingomonadaceae bacterium]